MRQIIKDVLKVKLLAGGILPSYSNDGHLFLTSNVKITIPPKSQQIVSTGICIQLKTNVHMDIQLLQVNELAKKKLYILNHPGTIDMDYRGEIKVIIYNFGGNSVSIVNGDIIGRLSFNMIKKTQFELYNTNKI